MKFFEDAVCQENKTGYTVCGDTYLCERRPEGTVFILCDGIGSGIYANIAAITCMSRIMELLNCGMSIRSASEMVASSMHRARTEDIPFSAFSAALFLQDGKFIIYTYEAPNVIVIRNGTASVLKPRFYTTGYEVLGETIGFLHTSDSLLLSSDGVTQAGLGHGYNLGIGGEGVAAYVNEIYGNGEDLRQLPRRVLEMCAGLALNRYEDDSTLALLHCRPAKQLTVLTGPPSKPSIDRAYVELFMNTPGGKVVCGSTTADIVSRELKEKITVVNLSSPYQPPEYHIDGIDLVTEGAIMLNQAYNILDEPLEHLVENSVVERFCIMLREADVINLMIGNAMNDAHEALLFKQIGVRVRRTTIKLIAEKLRKMGKLVVERYY